MILHFISDSLAAKFISIAFSAGALDEETKPSAFEVLLPFTFVIMSCIFHSGIKRRRWDLCLLNISEADDDKPVGIKLRRTVSRRG